MRLQKGATQMRMIETMYRAEQIAEGLYAVRNLLTGLYVISEGTFHTMAAAKDVAKNMNESGVKR